jgi:micrococcal nuclease
LAGDATAATRSLIDGRTVVLEQDVTDTDRFGRRLRYVWLERDDGWLLVNLELVRLGFARAGRYRPDTTYDTLLHDAERAARDARRGIWATAP